jgi:hypothetical protein
VNRFAVERVEFHAFLRYPERAYLLGNGVRFAVRYRNALPDARGTEFLPFKDRFYHIAGLLQFLGFRQKIDEFGYRRFLILSFQVDRDSFGIQKIHDFHLL